MTLDGLKELETRVPNLEILNLSNNQVSLVLLVSLKKRCKECFQRFDQKQNLIN